MIIYPRIHGEHYVVALVKNGITGSSPYTRGTRLSSHHPLIRSRFIPVYTGNTRSCGSFWYQTLGSSPYTRGTLSHTVRKSLKMRFIPVHTGNTPRISLRTIISPVHPRAYGEHLQSMQPVNIRYGSSPCIRGTLQIRWQSGTVPRFIPVHTGNT